MHLLKTVFLICFAFVSAGAIGSTLVESDVGSIEGFEKNGMECFRGIPYAENTAGERRFAPSVEKTKLQHHLKAFHFCPVVPQSGPIGRRSSSGMAEDSLCLNIYRPKNSTKGANYPVLVWIHGGSYVIGSSSSALYETGAFPRDGVILVTLNYRLNGLGFLASKTALREYGTTGNYGHLDIVTALKWIKHNIESFGGNPDNITLGGHSAGAFAVSSLILSPLADGLFSKAILQSGTILNYPFSDFYPHRARSRALKSSNLLFSMFGADDSYEGLNLLRKVDPLLISYNTPFDFDLYSNPTAYINPYFDGKVIPLDPLKALREGHYNQVKLLLGYT
ncbi:MAG: carboxylesterase family protein, partial [Succinivibrio sp.]